MLYGVTVKEDAGSFAPCLHSGFCKLLLGKCFLLFEVTSTLRCEPTAQRFPRRDKKRGRFDHLLCRNFLPTNKSQKNYKAAVRDPRTGQSIGRRPLCAHTLRGSKRTSCFPLLIWKGIFKGNLLPLERSFVSFSVVQKRKGRGFRGRPQHPKE